MWLQNWKSKAKKIKQFYLFPNFHFWPPSPSECRLVYATACFTSNLPSISILLGSLPRRSCWSPPNVFLLESSPLPVLLVCSGQNSGILLGFFLFLKIHIQAKNHVSVGVFSKAEPSPTIPCWLSVPSSEQSQPWESFSFSLAPSRSKEISPSVLCSNLQWPHLPSFHLIETNVGRATLWTEPSWLRAAAGFFLISL